MLALFVGGAGQAPAQIIESIRIEGTQRIDAETVRAYIALREGMRDDPREVDRAVKSLFASGLFADVTIKRVDGGLVVTVVENPIINRISFEGNSRITDDSLREESDLGARQIYTRAKVQDDVERFVELYRRVGRFAARIEPEVVQLPQNRVDLIFTINEGPLTRVQSINFLGNKLYSDDRLRREIATRESRWWRVFSSNDNYDPDRIAYDRELLRQFYLSRGYADFRVVSSVAELTRDGEEFFVTFMIEEGALYSFGDARVTSTLPTQDSDEMSALIKHEVGQTYDRRAIDDTIDALDKLVGEQGYAFGEVRPAIRRDREARRVDVEYRITEGPRVYIERININGNSRTQDRVIRREMRLSEGDAFNRVLVARSQRNIRALGFFSHVNISELPGTAPDKTILDVNVNEQSTGELSFGVGYSTVENFTTEFSIIERNFLGRGNSLRFQLGVSDQVQRYNIAFTEPHFLGRDVAAGFNLFSTVYDYSTEASIETREYGIGGNLGFPLSQNGRLRLFATMSRDELDNSAQTTSLVNQSYSDLKVETGYSYFIDKRDDAIFPTNGWDLSFGQDIAGPAGDISFLRTRLLADFFREISEGFVFHARSDLGVISDYRGGRVTYSNRFFKGGTGFRGFERSGVGPRQLSTGYILGANKYAIGTLQVSLPLGVSQETGMRANLFTDFGYLGGTDESPSTDIADAFDFRATYGLSLSWRSPFGPVRFDLAQPILLQDYDIPRRFRFTIGTRF